MNDLLEQLSGIRESDGFSVRVKNNHGIDFEPLVSEYNHLLDHIEIQARDIRRFEALSYRDELTGLANRRLFQEALAETLARARRSKSKVAVMYLDLDRFKMVNDTLGHEAGDVLLQEAAKRLQSCLRESDILARIGGDEFAVIAEGTSEPKGLLTLVQRMLESMKKGYELCGEEMFVGGSIGISVFPDDANNAQELLKNADIAMYRAKESRSGFKLYNPSMNDSVDHLASEENALREGIKAQEFELYFQPMVDAKQRQIVGAEALLRWPQQDGTVVSPVKFIPLAEATGLIEPLGEWVLLEACRIMQKWDKAGLPAVQISINASAAQFQNSDFATMAAKALEKYKLAASRLKVEITETLAMNDPETVIKVMELLHEHGVDIALDDFGTGYSSLSYLKRLPIDVLKLDRAFIKDVADHADDAAMISAMITMAHQLGLTVVAEGVEEEKQLDFLSSLNCDTIQGYFFSPPVPEEAFAELLARQASGKALY
ncbi:MAG: EAL domain-containing protein [Mariprofundaceae bacterium]